MRKLEKLALMNRVRPTMPNEIQRAICHEAGHAISALHMGFQVERISVNEGLPFCHIVLDTPDRTQEQRFIVLAAGIAAEQYLYQRHNPIACVKDEAMIAERGGGPIETYVPAAWRAIEINDRRFRSLVWKLTCRLQEELGSELLAAGGSLREPDSPSFDLLSGDDIQSI